VGTFPQKIRVFVYDIHTDCPSLVCVAWALNMLGCLLVNVACQAYLEGIGVLW